MKGALCSSAPEAERVRCAFAALADASVCLGAGFMHAKSAGTQKWRKRWVHLRSPQRRTLQRSDGSGGAGSAPASTRVGNAARAILRLYKVRDPAAVERCLLRNSEAARAEGEQLAMCVSMSTRVDATTLEVAGLDVRSGAAGELALRTQDAAQCDALERALQGHGEISSVKRARAEAEPRAIDRNALEQLLLAGIDELNQATQAPTLVLSADDINALLDSTFAQARELGAAPERDAMNGAINFAQFEAMCATHPLMTSHLRIPMLPATKPLGATPRVRSGIRLRTY